MSVAASQRNQKVTTTLRGAPSVNLLYIAIIVLLALVVAVVQGAGVSLLLPLVSLLGDSSEASGSNILWKITDRVLSSLGLPYSLPALSAAVLVMVILAQILNLGHHFMTVRTTERFGADLRHQAFQAFMYANIQFHQSHPAGTLLNGLNQEANRAAGTLMGIMELIARSLSVTIYLGLLVLISWQTALIALSVVIMVSLVSQLWFGRSRRTGKRMTDLWDSVIGFGMERIQGVRDVKLSVRESVESERFNGLVHSLATTSAQLAYRMTQIRLFLEPALVATGLLIIFVGTEFFSLSLAELAVLVYALLRMTPEARALNNARYQIASHIGSTHRLVGLIQEARQTAEQGHDHDEASIEQQLPTGLSSDIAFEQVVFSYHPTSQVLNGIDFALQAGETTAIVGPSGSGKSTILALLVRLLTPTSGRILFDGVPIQEFALSSLRRGIGLVSQDSAIFNDTVLNNITFGMPTATRENAENAARLANADGFIQELPQNYETVVGDRGMTLSAGQRQRLVLARALLLDPSVLLLDEITSAQDPESERAIQEAIWRAKSGRTVLIVTHRLSSIQGVDRVLVLGNGQIVEDGTPEELLRSNGLFRYYYDIQIGSGWEQGPVERQ